MLNPVIVWEPGTLVRYHGSHPDLCDGVYRAYPCTCLRCDDPILGTARFRLVDGADRVVVSCVRPRSITPIVVGSSVDQNAGCDEDTP